MKIINPQLIIGTFETYPEFMARVISIINEKDMPDAAFRAKHTADAYKVMRGYFCLNCDLVLPEDAFAKFRLYCCESCKQKAYRRRKRVEDKIIPTLDEL